MPDESVQSVERAIALLLTMDANSPSLDAATLSVRTGLSRSTTYRLLGTLEQTGVVRKRGSKFELGPSVLRLAAGYRAANHISIHAQAVLDDLADQVRTGVTLAVLDGDVVVTVETGNAVNGDYVLQPHELGRRIPAMATSVGRMLLSYQRDTRVDHDEAAQILRQGYALTSGLLEAGVRTIAVPVFDEHGAVVAGLGVIAYAERTSAEELEGAVLARLLEAAKRLSELRGWGPSHRS